MEADAAQSVIRQVAKQRLEERTRCCPILVDAVMSLDEGADEPGPDRSLVVRAVPLLWIAAIAAHVAR